MGARRDQGVGEAGLGGRRGVPLAHLGARRLRWRRRCRRRIDSLVPAKLWCCSRPDTRVVGLVQLLQQARRGLRPAGPAIWCWTGDHDERHKISPCRHGARAPPLQRPPVRPRLARPRGRCAAVVRPRSGTQPACDERPVGRPPSGTAARPEVEVLYAETQPPSRCSIGAVGVFCLLGLVMVYCRLVGRLSAGRCRPSWAVMEPVQTSLHGAGARNAPTFTSGCRCRSWHAAFAVPLMVIAD